MLKDPLHYPFNRRDFLKASTATSLALTLPGFFQRALGAQNTITDGRILIILELSGGNDGLNTIIPFADDAYHRLRPKLAMKKNKILNLENDLGLPESMVGIKRLYDNGHLAIINGVGYPNPNRSHFRSMEIWHTASYSNRYERDGWIGKFNDHQPGDQVDPLGAIAINNAFPQALVGQRGLGVAFQNPQAFRWRQGNQGDTHTMFRRLNKTSQKHDPDHRDPIHFLRQVTANIVKSSDRVIQAAKSAQQHVDYPNHPLARDLRSVAQLIGADLPTHVYHVALKGFDTHVNQAGSHERLLSQFSQSVTAFQQDIQAMGLSDRVVILCYSEFGRRASENASGGTDHGTAGPMFLIGQSVNPGLHGRYPGLTDLDENGDLKFNVDFRSVYAQVLKNWLNVDPAKVLGRSFPTIDLIRKP